MKKILLAVSVLLMAIGLFFSIAAGRETVPAFKGSLELGKTVQTDLDRSGPIKGDIFFVRGPFADYEEEQKFLGISLGKKYTKFYIIGNFDREAYLSNQEHTVFCSVFSTTDKEMMNKLDAAAADWQEYFDANGEGVDTPSCSIPFSGMLRPVPEDDVFKKSYKSMQMLLMRILVTEDMYTKMRITDQKVPAPVMAVFWGGVVIIAGGIVMLVMTLKRGAKKPSVQSNKKNTNNTGNRQKKSSNKKKYSKKK